MDEYEQFLTEYEAGEAVRVAVAWAHWIQGHAGASVQIQFHGEDGTIWRSETMTAHSAELELATEVAACGHYRLRGETPDNKVAGFWRGRRVLRAKIVSAGN